MGHKPGIGYLRIFRRPGQKVTLQLPGQADPVVIEVRDVDLTRDPPTVELGIEAHRSVEIVRNELLNRDRDRDRSRDGDRAPNRNPIENPPRGLSNGERYYDPTDGIVYGDGINGDSDGTPPRGSYTPRP